MSGKCPKCPFHHTECYHSVTIMSVWSVSVLISNLSVQYSVIWKILQLTAAIVPNINYFYTLNCSISSCYHQTWKKAFIKHCEMGSNPKSFHTIGLRCVFTANIVSGTTDWRLSRDICNEEEGAENQERG